MTGSSWLDELPVLGTLPPEQAAAKLREVGEEEAADALESAAETAPASYGLPKILGGKDRAWRHTAHAVGHLAAEPPSPGELMPIRHAGHITPDETLKNARIKLTLDGLRVADYPGKGVHRVLFDFAANNQVAKGSEHVHFNATYRAAEGEQAAVIGRPIFVGLKVGAEGVLLQCATVNVKNDDDEAFLAFLETDAFKTGLTLITTLQPALVPFSAMAMSLTKAIAARNRNVAVQAIEVGLDFSTVPTRVRLAEGAYVFVQVPQTLTVIWKWEDWGYDPVNGYIVRKANRTQLLPYNYLVVGVSRYQGS
jgi:hypothetical protein